MNRLTLTKKEEKITTHCEDFCPIYQSLKEYNATNRHKICCPTEMCKRVTETYVLNQRCIAEN